jgi:hypothetical protein
LAFSISITSAAETSPNFAMGLSGNVNIGAQPAPVNTIIDARVLDKSVGTTVVQNVGLYGDKGNNRLAIITDDGANVDIYVNNVKAGSIIYRLQDAGKIIPLDLNAPGTSSGTSSGSSSSSGSGTGGGGVSGAGGTPTVTAIQQKVGSQQAVSGTPAKGTPVTTPGVPPEFKFSTILGVFGLLALGAIIIFALKKMGKI